jgi:hypothetical protein
MAFLDNYDSVERIDVGHGYWVDVRVCVLRGDNERAERLLAQTTVTPDEQRPGRMHTMVTPDTAAWRTEMVFASIVAWNLDEQDGTVWALEPEPAKRANIRRLPGPVFDAVWARVDELNKAGGRTPQDQAAFRDAAGGSDPERWAGPGSVVEVPAGEGVLDAAGASAGRPGQPALA